MNIKINRMWAAGWVSGCAAAWMVAAASGQVSLGAAGDSLTDEYAEETYNYAMNWVQQLEQFRAVDLGPTAAEAGQSGGTWGEPRRMYFKNDWARYGATSASLLSDGQHTGLASMAADIDHAVIAIGANDFSPTSSAYINIYFGIWSASQITNYVNGRIANVTTAVNTVSNSGIKTVLVGFPDYGVAPITYTSGVYNDPVRRERVSTAIRRVNDGLKSLARAKGLPYVDLYGLSWAMFGSHTQHNSTLTIGGVSINLLENDTTSHSNPLAGFVHDGVHPHTTLQGLFANVMMTALDLGYNTGFTAFSEQEILQHAGLSYGGSDTIAAQLGAWTDYIVNFACLADVNEDSFVNGLDYDLFAEWFESADPLADYNGDGFVNGIDYDEFAEQFESGC
ncbi:MAG: hypothetical protein IT432_00565 [Phycisphaerales bacterium]|nr:hypothetical protein [Phycisphaerales bacterium]